MPTLNEFLEKALDGVKLDEGRMNSLIRKFEKHLKEIGSLLKGLDDSGSPENENISRDIEWQLDAMRELLKRI